VGGTKYNNHTLEPFKELGLDFQIAKKHASKLYVHSVNMLPSLSIPGAHFPISLSILIRSRFQVKPATLLISIDIFLSLWFTLPVTKSGSFSLVNVGNVFSPLALFLFFSRLHIVFFFFEERFCLRIFPLHLDYSLQSVMAAQTIRYLTDFQRIRLSCT